MTTIEDLAEHNTRHSGVYKNIYKRIFLQGAKAQQELDYEHYTSLLEEKEYQLANLIDNACNWLRAELNEMEIRHYIHVHGFDDERREEFLERFTKAMKGE